MTNPASITQRCLFLHLRSYLNVEIVVEVFGVFLALHMFQDVH